MNSYNRITSNQTSIASRFVKGYQMNWDSLKVASPKESMHSELLMHLDRQDIEISDRTSHPHYEVAAWLELKNTEHLPAMLVMEYTDRNGSFWQILDTATIRSTKGKVLLSGIATPRVNHIKEISVYLCHPSPFIHCEVEELRFNDKLIEEDYLETFNVA